MKLPLSRLFPLAAAAGEGLSMLALFLSPEVPRPAFGMMIVFFIAAFFLKLRDLLLLPVIALVVLGALYAGLKLDIPVAQVAAVPMLAVHGLTWLAREQNRYRYWRVGLAFLEMILAAILAPEGHMFFLIFFFVIMVSLTLSFGFLSENFRARDPAGLERPLRGAFLGAVLALSLVIFLSSLVIFPLLPRREDAGSGSFGAMPGYNEEVSFQTATFYWTGDESKPVMWIFPKDNSGWEKLIPYGLLRGKTLEHFNGQVWKALPKRAVESWDPRGRVDSVEILREPMPTEVLITPYGAAGVELINQSGVGKYRTTEWYAYYGKFKRLSYEVALSGKPELDQEIHPSERELPAGGFTRLIALGRQLGQGARSDEAKIEAVERYFADFTAQQVPVAAAAEQGPSPVEDFVFNTRTGHCELFATASALMLRAMGIPTRLVVGFRAPTTANGKVITVRNGDAHAWLEAWAGGKWTIVDPTPAIIVPQSRWQAARDFYDWVTAYWHRFILGYEFNWAGMLKWVAIGLGAVIALGLVRGIARALRSLTGKKERDPREAVVRERRWLEKKLNTDQLEARLQKLEGGAEWWETYERYRFGRETKGAEKELRGRSTALVQRARAEPPAH